MAIITLGAIGASIAAGIGWFTSLPNTFKYIIFLGGLTADSGVTIALGINSGAVGGLITLIISNTFNLPHFAVSSFELLIVFTALPVVLFFIKNGRVGQ